MLRNLRLSALLSLTVVPVLAISHPAFAQTANQKDNDTLAAAVKAAIYVEGKGEASVQPGVYTLFVELEVKGKERAATQAEYKRLLGTTEKILTKNGDAVSSRHEPYLERSRDGKTYDGVELTPETEAKDKPEDQFRIAGGVGVSVKTPAEARFLFAALRAANIPGSVRVTCWTGNRDAIQTVVLKAAIAQANKQVKALGDSVKPKEFDLVYIKSGELKADAWATPIIQLQGAEPLPEFPALKVSTTATVFYGFKPTATASKPVKAADAEPAEPVRVAKD